MKRYYLAYGSNLNVRQMKWRCPTAKAIGTAIIKDYELLFKGSKTGAYLTIEPKVGAEVPVAVWAVEPSDELNLDRYEGYPTFYYKAELDLPVRYFSGKTVVRTAFVYIMHEERPLPDLNFTIKLFKPCFEMPYFDFGNILAVRKSFQNAHIQSTKAENFYILRFVIGLLV